MLLIAMERDWFIGEKEFLGRQAPPDRADACNMMMVLMMKVAVVESTMKSTFYDIMRHHDFIELFYTFLYFFILSHTM